MPMEQDELNLKIPYVCTLHGNRDNQPVPKNTICISKNHAARHNRTSFVYNGLDEKKIPLNESNVAERQYFSFLGKASLKEKALTTQKKISKQLKTPLQVGGGKGLPWPGIKYLGQVDNNKKFKLLGNSKGLLFPIEWEEPFGFSND